MKKLLIIIPAYNEEKRIEETLKSYSNYFAKLEENSQLSSEILVIINNTNDRTEQIVRKNMLKKPMINYLNFRRGGKGFAIVKGFEEALKKDYDYVGFVDADMSTSPKHFYDLFLAVRPYDCAIASRYLKNSIVEPKQTLKRRIVSRIFNSLIKSLLFLHYEDTQCGAKIFKRSLIKEVLPKITFSKWAFDVDLLYQSEKVGGKIREVPTTWKDKEHSKINFWRAGPWMFLGIVRIRLINSPLKFLLRVYDKFLGTIWCIKL